MLDSELCAYVYSDKLLQIDLNWHDYTDAARTPIRLYIILNLA